MERSFAARVLRVDAASTPAQLHAAYRRRARELHPDTGHGDEAAMAQLNEAYETLRAHEGAGWEFATTPPIDDGEPNDAGELDDVDVAIGATPSPLRAFAIVLAVVGLVTTTVVFVAAIGYDWSLSP